MTDSADNEVGTVERLIACGELASVGRGKLRRVPFDPMTGKAEWGRRCYQDDADDTSWCGENVWDVYSRSGGVGLDGSDLQGEKNNVKYSLKDDLLGVGAKKEYGYYLPV